LSKRGTTFKIRFLAGMDFKSNNLLLQEGPLKRRLLVPAKYIKRGIYFEESKH